MDRRPDKLKQRQTHAHTHERSSDCHSLLPNTLIEVWQTNEAGLYDTDKPGQFTEHVDFRLRAKSLSALRVLKRDC